MNDRLAISEMIKWAKKRTKKEKHGKFRYEYSGDQLVICVTHDDKTWNLWVAKVIEHRYGVDGVEA